MSALIFLIPFLLIIRRDSLLSIFDEQQQPFYSPFLLFDIHPCTRTHISRHQPITDYWWAYMTRAFITEKSSSVFNHTFIQTKKHTNPDNKLWSSSLHTLALQSILQYSS